MGLPLPPRIGVAVSGGGDSLALLHLLKGIYSRRGGVVEAVTVDHGLRNGADAEAQRVGEQAVRLGVTHEVLRWEGWDGTGNLQDAARQARYTLMAQWAQARGLDAVALGHTADDQAETVLMRLARRSGVDGLAAMAPRREDHGVLWLRPLLSVGRAALRAHLTATGVRWVDDPSNEDTRFDRIKARRALTALAGLGIDAGSLGVVAQNMGEAREALETYTRSAARRCMRLSHGAVVFDRAALLAHPPEVQRRLWRRAIDWIAPAPYPPRRTALAQLMRAVSAGHPTTLGGCAMICRKEDAWLFRELNSVTEEVAKPQGAWDARWHCRAVEGASAPEGAELRMLSSNGLKQCDNWRDLDLPRAVLLSHPALWHGDTVLCSPAAKPLPNWRWELLRDDKAFFDTAL